MKYENIIGLYTEPCGTPILLQKISNNTLCKVTIINVK